jgi:hypothetical protein
MYYSSDFLKYFGITNGIATPPNYSTLIPLIPNTTFSITGQASNGTQFATQLVDGLFVSPFVWNWNGGNGSVTINISNGVEIVTAKVLPFIYTTPSIPIGGYPMTVYGCEYFFPLQGCSQINSALPLPETLSNLPNFDLILYYQVLYQMQGFIADLSYDIWLMNPPTTTDLTYQNTIEVMIYLYHNISQNGQQYFVYLGTQPFEAIVDGQEVSIPFRVIVLPRTGSSNGWIGVYFVPAFRLPPNLSITLINVNNILNYAYTVATQYGATGTYYLNSIRLGGEITPSNNQNLSLSYIYSNAYIGVKS